MVFFKSKIDGLYIITPQLFEDERGYFTRTFCQNEFKKNGLKFNIVQTNLSLTKQKGSIRGMHFQLKPKEEEKIVQCLKGRVFDVAIDLREGSPTFGDWVGELLDEENKKMLFIPKGFAHGFQTLTDNCQLLYYMSEFYTPELSAGVLWNDPFFKIDWPLKPTVINEKDQNWPLIDKR